MGTDIPSKNSGILIREVSATNGGSNYLTVNHTSYYNGAPSAVTLPEVAEVLKQYYQSGNHLSVQRLNGESLPMETCYINLAIIPRPPSPKGLHKSQTISFGEPQESRDPFSLATRLNAEPSGECAKLEELFKARRNPDGEILIPKRILIRGRAGVGKTTLCKKIVHDFIRHGMWKERFDLLIWIPLRMLKHAQEHECYDLTEILTRYLRGSSKSEQLVKLALDAIHGPARDKTLFILDGLDEVSTKWDSNSTMDKSVKSLLEKENVIITSRPYTLDGERIGMIDLELETIGFFPEQITAYLQNRNILVDTKTAEDIQTFLDNHSAIRGLARIPVQLDALCTIWRDHFHKEGPETMTDIYQSIVDILWRKDLPRLKPEQSYSEAELKGMLPSKVEEEAQKATNLVEGLAFYGMYRERDEFGKKDQDWICNHLRKLNKEVPDAPHLTLEKLSVFRTSDDNVEGASRMYHFLHLTFQEFFAARHFVRKWLVEKPLLCLHSPRDVQSVIMPLQFLQNEKYNSRYDILWRFVAGLLYTGWGQHEESNEPLNHFFQELESGPRDLLGPAHQRLIMHCLNELPESGSRGTLQNHDALKQRLVQWAVFEIQFAFKSTFLSELRKDYWRNTLRILNKYPRATILYAMEGNGKFPEHILTDFLVPSLRDENDEVARETLVILSEQSHLPQIVVDELFSFLRNRRRGHVSMSLSITLRLIGDLVPRPDAKSMRDFMTRFIRCLQSTNDEFRRLARMILNWLSSRSNVQGIAELILYATENGLLLPPLLSEDRPLDTIHLINNEDILIAVHCLQSNFWFEEFYDTITPLLTHNDIRTKFCAHTSMRFAPVPQKYKDWLVPMLINGNNAQKVMAIEAFSVLESWTLQAEALDYMASFLENRCSARISKHLEEVIDELPLPLLHECQQHVPGNEKNALWVVHVLLLQSNLNVELPAVLRQLHERRDIEIPFPRDPPVDPPPDIPRVTLCQEIFNNLNVENQIEEKMWRMLRIRRHSLSRVAFNKLRSHIDTILEEWMTAEDFQAPNDAETTGGSSRSLVKYGINAMVWLEAVGLWNPSPAMIEKLASFIGAQKVRRLLGKREDIPEATLHKLVLLTHSSRDATWAVVHILPQQEHLPLTIQKEILSASEKHPGILESFYSSQLDPSILDEIVKILVANDSGACSWLRSSPPSIDGRSQHILRILETQSTLTQRKIDVLSEWATLIYTHSRDAQIVLNVLEKHSTHLCIVSGQQQLQFELWLKRAFKEQLSLCARGGTLILDSSERSKRIDLGFWADWKFHYHIRQKRKKLGVTAIRDITSDIFDFIDQAYLCLANPYFPFVSLLAVTPLLMRNPLRHWGSWLFVGGVLVVKVQQERGYGMYIRNWRRACLRGWKKLFRTH